MNNKSMSEELNMLLSKSSTHYKQLVKENYLKFNFREPVILFGAAKLGNIFIDYFKRNGTKILALSDNNNRLIGKCIRGINIIEKGSIKGLYGKDIQVVATSQYYPEIMKDLKILGISNIFNPMYFFTLYSKNLNVQVWKNDISLISKNAEQINLAFDYLSDNESRKIFLSILKFRLTLNMIFLKHIQSSGLEYFDKKIIKLSDIETFIDGGAYDGDTIKMFINESKNMFNNIYAFEPDSNNYRKLNRNVKKLSDPRIKIFKLGLGDKKNIRHFTNEGNLQSKINKYGKALINIVPIDNYIATHFTSIKLDIEGYEKKALHGSRNVIKKYKPRLIVCVYHNLYDLWELPILIKSIKSDYKIYLRHYSNFLMNTICYAV